MKRFYMFFLAGLILAGCDAIRGDADFEAKLTGDIEGASFRGDATAFSDPADEGRRYSIVIDDPGDLKVTMVYDSVDPLQSCVYRFTYRSPERDSSPDASVSGTVESDVAALSSTRPDTTIHNVSLEVKYRSDTVIEGLLRIDGYLEDGTQTSRQFPDGYPRFVVRGRFKARGENLMPDISDTIRPCP